MESNQPNTDTNKDTSKYKSWLSFRNRLRWSIFRRDKFTCRYCGRTVKEGIQLELEHLVPVSKGGDYSEDNLLTSCHECNTAKDDSLLTEFEILIINGGQGVAL